MRLLTVLLLCLLLPDIAAAAVFTPPPTDKSVSLLGVIFGSHMGPITLGGSPNPALEHMFTLFNVIVICLGTVIVSYIGIISTINTAQEGSALGKKWTHWVILRAVIGMTFIVPTPGSGYSVIQTVIMSLIIQGIGAADMIWNKVLDDYSSGLSPTKAIHFANNPTRPETAEPPAIQTLRDQGINLADDTLESAVCMAVIQNIASGKATQDFKFKAPANSVAARYGRQVRWYVIEDKNIISTNELAAVAGTAYIGVQGDPRFYDLCGSYRVSATVHKSEWAPTERANVSKPNLETQAKNIYTIKMNALHSMFKNYNSLAQEIAAQGDALKPRHFQTKRLTQPFNDEIVEPAGYKPFAMNTYVIEMQQAIKPHKIAGTQQVLQQGKLNGWIDAGSFFFALNQTSEVDYFDTITDDPPIPTGVPACRNRTVCSTVLPTDSQVLGSKLNAFLEDYDERAFLASRLWDASVYLRHDVTQVAQRLDGRGIEAVVNPIGPRGAHHPEGIDVLQHHAAELIRNMMTEQNYDPILAQGKFGGSLIRLAEQTWSETLAEYEVTIDRLAAEERPLTAAERAHLEGLNTHNALVLSLCAIVWGIGVMLAIYIPLIPYLIFTVAVVGWFLLVVEAIVAAPILAISFMLPAGEELGKIMQGLMLLLNIVLRPAMMLFGFILAARLYQAVVHLVNFSIVGNLDNLDIGESVYAWIAILAIYGAFTVSLANKCFALIYALPDKILRWMGGGPENTSVDQEMHSVKGGIGKGEEIAKQISSGFIKRDMTRLDSRAKDLAGDEVLGGGKGRKR